MDKKHDKLMTDIQRLLETQNFKSEKEMKSFLDGITGKPIPSFPKAVLNNQEKAQDLVYEASELSPAKAKAKIKKALQLDPDCIEAYEYLASTDRSLKSAMMNYEKGIAIGKRIFGGKYLEEHKGMFWGFHETRPFMRCLQHYADCLYTSGKVKECIEIFEEMIELNPNDNQGARDLLLLYLIQIDAREKFVKYAKEFKDDYSAFILFNRALFAFKTEGETKNANKILKAAIERNKFVAKLILSDKPIKVLPEYYGWGDENEAIYYSHFAYHIWKDTKEAMEWLRKYAFIQ
ncbi:MAG: hypothetical protein NTV87_06935 [Ignavibacteriae bacterium]|nr:hypothetical protein [Ignavibacteriota bacterium]